MKRESSQQELRANWQALMPLALTVLLACYTALRLRGGGLIVSICAMICVLVAYYVCSGYTRRVGCTAIAAIAVVYAVVGAITRLTSALDWVVFAVWGLGGFLLLKSTTRRIDALEREREHQSNVNQHMTLIDDRTALRNLRAFKNDADIYQRIAYRHNMYLWLALWKLTNAAQLKEMLGEDRFSELTDDISTTLRTVIRFEDMMFLIDSSGGTLTWGTLHIANTTQYDAVLARTRVKLGQIKLPEGAKIQIDVRICIADNEVDKTPTDFLNRALESPVISC